MFKSWLVEYGHEHDMAVEQFALSMRQAFKKHNNVDHRASLCTVIDLLSDALRSEKIIVPLGRPSRVY